jgi:hypothetical protein
MVLLEQHRTRLAQLAAQGRTSHQSDRLLREMERAVAGFQRHLALLQRERLEEANAAS